jgi:ribosomal protein S18 acetylase RimI-like enzyme
VAIVMRCEDWRQAGAAEVAPLLAREQQRWLAALGWDLTHALGLAEEGRRSGRLPGFLARAAEGACIGWTFFAVDRGTLNIGMLAGDRADVVRELLDCVIEAPEAAYARRYQGFLYPGNSAIAVALARRRFVVVPQLLLVRSLRGQQWPDTPPPGRPLLDSDVPDAIRLFARAYAGMPSALAFAPEGRLEEWASYFGHIAKASACGPLVAQWSRVVPDQPAGRPAAVLLTTATAPGVWHIAQVAVDPARRREGLARRLVTAALSAAAEEGARELTLVVDAGNTAARALYQSLGFVERTQLVFASRPRLTRVVQASAGAATIA